MKRVYKIEASKRPIPSYEVDEGLLGILKGRDEKTKIKTLIKLRKKAKIEAPLGLAPYLVGLLGESDTINENVFRILQHVAPFSEECVHAIWSWLPQAKWTSWCLPILANGMDHESIRQTVKDMNYLMDYYNKNPSQLLDVWCAFSLFESVPTSQVIRDLIQLPETAMLLVAQLCDSDLVTQLYIQGHFSYIVQKGCKPLLQNILYYGTSLHADALLSLGLNDLLSASDEAIAINLAYLVGASSLRAFLDTKDLTLLCLLAQHDDFLPNVGKKALDRYKATPDPTLLPFIQSILEHEPYHNHATRIGLHQLLSKEEEEWVIL